MVVVVYRVCVCGGGDLDSALGKSEEDYPIWIMKNFFLRDIQYSD